MELKNENVNVTQETHLYDTCDVTIEKKKCNNTPQIRIAVISWKHVILMILVVVILSICTTIAVTLLMNTKNGCASKPLENRISRVIEDVNKTKEEPTQPKDIDGTLRDCLEWKQNGSLTDGVYSISPDDTTILDVYCDMTTDGGGWVVVQRRSDGSENFFRGWQAYEDGFGDINGEFWIGNKYLYILTQVPTELRIDLKAWDGQEKYAKYSTFVIGDAESKYTLSVDGFGGNAGDGLNYHHGLKFSTFDQDNTQRGTKCAARNKGAWWYKACSHSSLNGEYLKTNGTADQNMGINWEKFKGDHYSLKATSMMLRRKT